jgi:hypothetical protein
VPQALALLAVQSIGIHYRFDKMNPSVTSKTDGQEIEGQTRPKPVTQSHRTKALPA